MRPRSLSLRDLNPRILVGLPPRRRRGLVAALRAVLGYLGKLVAVRGWT